MTPSGMGLCLADKAQLSATNKQHNRCHGQAAARQAGFDKDNMQVLPPGPSTERSIMPPMAFMPPVFTEDGKKVCNLCLPLQGLGFGVPKPSVTRHCKLLLLIFGRYSAKRVWWKSR